MKTRNFTLLLIALLAIGSAQAAGLSGRDIMQKVKNRPDGDTRYANVEMTLIQRSGHKRIRKLESWAMDIGKDTKKIMFFTYPGDVKGTGDFTYNDMSMRNVDEEKHQLLREENLGGHRCWVVQSIPNDKDEIYARRVTWIRQDCLMAVKAEYYDKLNKLHRRLTISNIDKVQGFWTMHLMQMENVQTGHKTVIRMDNQRFNIKVAPNLFTVSKLEKGL